MSKNLEKLHGVDRGHHWGGALARWGGGGAIGGGGSTVGVPSTSKNRPSHHKYKSAKQFEQALRALHARLALPVYPFLRTKRFLFIPFLRKKSQKRQTTKPVKRKIA